ncbi:MAG: hypothetical protein KGI54_17135 [Pseudomonadota bacterium]|nr:hypothetical protein [Pseudomonadota bacterium]
MTIRSPLARLLPSKTSDEDLHEIKAAGWREQRILVVSADDKRLNWLEKQVIETIAERIYGKSGG